MTLAPVVATVVKVPFAPVVERSTLNPVSLGELSCQARPIAPGDAVAERLDGPFWLPVVLANDAASASGASGRSGSQRGRGRAPLRGATRGRSGRHRRGPRRSRAWARRVPCAG